GSRGYGESDRISSLGLGRLAFFGLRMSRPSRPTPRCRFLFTHPLPSAWPWTTQQDIDGRGHAAATPGRGTGIAAPRSNCHGARLSVTYLSSRYNTGDTLVRTRWSSVTWSQTWCSTRSLPVAAL